MKDLFSVAGKTALVTGATSGIGLMMARGFAENGATVFITSRTKENCESVAAELSQVGKAIALPGDVSTMAGVEALVAAFAQHSGKLNVLVNNAGALHDQPLDEFSEEGWDSVVDLNLKSAFFLTQKLLPALRAAASEAAPASIINIGSVGGLRIGPRETYSYAAAKAGLHHMTKSLSKRLGREHITVNALAPGFFPSRMTVITPQIREAVLAQVPMRRTGEAEDMAAAALYLASRAGSFITGAVIPVDGGMSV